MIMGANYFEEIFCKYLTKVVIMIFVDENTSYIALINRNTTAQYLLMVRILVTFLFFIH